jgi:hypothetical protein
MVFLPPIKEFPHCWTEVGDFGCYALVHQGALEARPHKFVFSTKLPHQDSYHHVTFVDSTTPVFSPTLVWADNLKPQS